MVAAVTAATLSDADPKALDRRGTAARHRHRHTPGNSRTSGPGRATRPGTGKREAGAGAPAGEGLTRRRRGLGCGKSRLKAWGNLSLAELGFLSPELTKDIPVCLRFADVAVWLRARCHPPGSSTTNVPGCSAAGSCPFSINPLRTSNPRCALGSLTEKNPGGHVLRRHCAGCARMASRGQR